MHVLVFEGANRGQAERVCVEGFDDVAAQGDAADELGGDHDLSLKNVINLHVIRMRGLTTYMPIE